jgi:hypothetical protein
LWTKAIKEKSKDALQYFSTSPVLLTAMLVIAQALDLRKFSRA